MFYQVTIGYESENESGRVKMQKVKSIIEAESVEETTIIANKYLEGDTRDAQLLSVNHLPIDCVISPTTYPQYYKSK